MADETNPPAPGASAQPPPAPGAPSTPPATGGSDDAKRVAMLEKELAEARKEAAAARVAKNEQRSAAEKAALEQGEYKKLAESLQARVAELSPLEADASAWREHNAKETERLKKARETLDPAWHAAFDATTTNEARVALLSAIEGTKSSGPKPPPTKAPPGGGPPGAPPSPNTDWEALADSPAELRAARVRDPAGWNAYVARLEGGSKAQPSTFERRQQAAAAARAAAAQR